MRCNNELPYPIIKPNKWIYTASLKYLNLLCIYIILTSCSTEKSPVGLYGKCFKNGYFAYSQIEFKPDNTFEYLVVLDVGGGTLMKGNWKQLSKDSLLLNTLEQPKNPSTTYKAKFNPDRTDIQIKISDLELPLAAAYIMINDKEAEKIADFEGIAKFKKRQIRTITYQYLGQQETIVIDHPNYNEIEIIVRDLDVNAVPRFLTDKIMIIKNRKLFFNESYFLKKTRIKNRQWN